MPYIKKKISYAKNDKAYKFLMQNGFSMKAAQRAIDKGRLIDKGGIICSKNATLNGEVFLIEYECEPKGLKPIFDEDEFAVFEKPSGVLTHPNGRHCEYSMNDEIISLFGREAKVAHRLDRETSGLLLVAKNREAEINFKKMFESKQVKKEYIAMVKGQIWTDFEVENQICIDKSATTLRSKMYVNDQGKFAMTKFKVIKTFANLDVTFLRCIPKTGRQHQIRVHLECAKHAILGDTLYGVDDWFACDFLDGKISDESRAQICGSSRLLLHSNLLEFEYKNMQYKIVSEIDVENEFLAQICK